MSHDVQPSRISAPSAAGSCVDVLCSGIAWEPVDAEYGMLRGDHFECADGFAMIDGDMGPGTGCDFEVPLQDRGALRRRDLNESHLDGLAVTDDSMAVRGPYVAHPVGVRAEHGHGVPGTVNIGEHDRERNQLARATPPHLELHVSRAREPPAGRVLLRPVLVENASQPAGAVSAIDPPLRPVEVTHKGPLTAHAVDCSYSFLRRGPGRWRSLPACLPCMADGTINCEPVHSQCNARATGRAFRCLIEYCPTARASGRAHANDRLGQVYRISACAVVGLRRGRRPGVGILATRHCGRQGW